MELEVCGTLPADWDVASIEDVCERVTSGGTPSRTRPEYFTDGSWGWVKTQELRDAWIDQTEERITDDAIENSSAKVLPANTVLLALYGATVGQLGILRRPMTCNQACCAMIFDQRKADFRYVYHQLRLARPQLRSLATGAAQQNLSGAVMKSLRLPLPPLPEQKRIARILGTLDDKIELNRRMNSTLEGISRAVFKSWFVDFDPVRQKATGKQPVGMDAQTAALFPDSFEDSEIGEVPKGWETTVLDEVLEEIETGGRPKGGVSGYSSGVPSIGAESIVGLGAFDYGKTKFVPREFYDKMTKGRVQSRDVLLYKDGGRPGQFEPHVTLFGDGFPFAECAINEHVYRLRAKPAFGQALLYFWLSSDMVMEEMRVKGTGVAIPGLNSTQAKSLTTLRPSPVVARAFNQRVEPAISRVLSNCNASRTLAALRDTLLPKLLSGEIRVPEAEEAVEEAVR